jgi:hypothetical protein
VGAFYSKRRRLLTTNAEALRLSRCDEFHQASMVEELLMPCSNFETIQPPERIQKNAEFPT